MSSTPSGNGNNDRISVSRDALRADLAEMELRLREWIAKQLETKADETIVLAMANQMTDLRARAVFQDGPLAQAINDNTKEIRKFAEGNFTEAQKRALHEIVEKSMTTHAGSIWTGRSRIVMIAMAVMTLFSLAFTAVYTTFMLLHG
jgi:hypothetical protein